MSEPDLSAILAGAVDQHVHSGPSAIRRGIDHLGELEEAAGAGFRAVLLKDHYYATGPFAAFLNERGFFPGTKVLSGIALNNTAGGFSPFAVAHEALMGGRIAWLPTVSAANHIAYAAEQAKAFDHPSREVALPAETPLELMEAGAIRDDVRQVLDTVAEHDMVLAGGHLHIDEIHLVFDEARKRGVGRFLLNHPESIIKASFEDVRQLAAANVFIEHSMTRFVPGSRFRKYEPDLLRRHIEAAGVGRTILASDMGQARSASPVQGMREAVRLCLDLGYSSEEVRTMISINPSSLLGL